MSLSSVVFLIVCTETLTEFNVHSYIRFHPQLMNYLVEKYIVPQVFGLCGFFSCLILTFSWYLLKTLDIATLPINYWCPSFFFVTGNIVKILLVSD